MYTGAPLIQGNTIANNARCPYGSGQTGDGVYLDGPARVVGNLITGNNGNGIGIFGSGPALVEDNVVEQNAGVGLWSVNDFYGLVAQNLIAGDDATGVGYQWGSSPDPRCSRLCSSWCRTGPPGPR